MFIEIIRPLSHSVRSAMCARGVVAMLKDVVNISPR
jgi:hypothetical protein